MGFLDGVADDGGAMNCRRNSARDRFLLMVLIVGLTACGDSEALGALDDAAGEVSDGSDFPDEATAPDDSATLDDSDPEIDLDSGADASESFDADAESSDTAGDGPEEQGPFDPCGTSDVGPCRADLQCLAIPGISGTRPFCAPPCATDGSCPSREGVAGYCVLGLPSADPTLCGLLCEPEGSASCPPGMTCMTVTGGGLCLWPS